jgi:cobalt-zinc-cadmium efflux system outer membrane protein
MMTAQGAQFRFSRSAARRRSNVVAASCRQFHPLAYWVIVVVLLTGCQTVAPPSRAPRSSGDPGTRVNKARAYSIPSNAGPDELAVFGGLRHPSVIAAEAKVRRLMAKVPQAEALPDPKLRVAAGSMAETAAGRADWMTGVEQALPFPGKLREMAAAAGKEAQSAAAELEVVRLDVAEQIRGTYWDYFLAVQTTAITSETKSVLEQVRDSIDVRVAANQATQGDQLRIATEFGKLERALIEACRAERSAEARLNSLLNRPAGAPLPNPGVRQLGGRGELKTLLAKAEASHPSVAAAEAKVDAFRHRLNRAKLDRYPDFVVGLQHVAISDGGLAPSANGRDQVFGTLGISLPLWQEPRRARVAEAMAGIDEASAGVEASRSKLRFRVEDAWVRAQSADELIRLFDKQILPESKQAFDLVLTGYSAGTNSFVDILDAWRSWLGFQLQQAGNRTKLGKAMAALRSATGQ